MIREKTPALVLKILIFLILSYSCARPYSERTFTDLSGTWQFTMDSSNAGIAGEWYNRDLNDSIELPGTMDLRKKGFINKDTTTLHLNRLYKYEGIAWYRRHITIPDHAAGKRIILILERTKSTTVWVDGQLAGNSALMQSAQEFDLTQFLTPGKHTVAIRVDNSLSLTPYGNVHIYSDDTQTNWNGILGKIGLEVSSHNYITDLQVYPDVDNKKFTLKLGMQGAPEIQNVNVELRLTRIKGGRKKNLKTLKHNFPADSVFQLEYVLGDKMELWDEFQRPLYQLTAVISDGSFSDSKTVTFGMRKFSAEGTQFSINGRKVFLRGKNDACVFPLTGFPPMEVNGWVDLFRKAKSYGINHYRFHSWCPPEAAFEAADMEGIYLQPELPFWGGLESDSIAEMLKSEGIAMLRSYANHPSFVMFSHGNEIWSGHDRVEKNILTFRTFDNRPLYAMGSNNNIGYVAPRECADFFVAARTPYTHDTVLTHTRLTQAFADSRDGGILNTRIPSTAVNFDYAVSQIKIPMVSHETGQYQIYPDYSEIDKYTGVLKAWNMSIFRNRLMKAGMLDMNKDFQKASGAWSALCYKAEMEAALRTKGLAGFQLLDLQDFPGQGTALVGILDAFMDDKGVIERNDWLNSCNDVVVLLSFPKYCWSDSENFNAKIHIANYSNHSIEDGIIWTVTNSRGEILFTGNGEDLHISEGGLMEAGEIGFMLNNVKLPDKLNIHVSLKGSGYFNNYPVWVYEKPGLQRVSEEVFIAGHFDEDLVERLNKGAKVLLFPKPDDVRKNSVGGLFPPEFWNYGMFKGISERVNKPVSPGTLGILTNPGHPVFRKFPTDFHTNWQWFSVIKASRPVVLDNLDKEYRPIVQVIDNAERNYKLGLIFEFAVGKGKLLVCASRITEILELPEAYSLYNSLLDYMESEEFNPAFQADEKMLKDLFN